jgi:hypothetical protein
MMNGGFLTLQDDEGAEWATAEWASTARTLVRSIAGFLL